MNVLQTINVPVSPLYLTKANIRGRDHVHMRSAGLVYVHIFSLYSLCTEFIISSLHFQRLNIIVSRLKAIHLQAWLSSQLFIFHSKSDKTVWTLCYRVVFRAMGSDKYTGWLKAGTRRWTGAFLSCFIKKGFHTAYILYAILYNLTLSNLKASS